MAKAHKGLGDTDFFGLDEFGDFPGKEGLMGVAAGGLVGTAVAIGVRAASTDAKVTKWSEGIGLAAAAAVGGVFMAMGEKWKAAGWAAILTSAFTNGVRQLEQLFGEGKPGTSDWGSLVMEPTHFVGEGAQRAGLQGLGIHTIDNGYVVQGGSLSGGSVGGLGAMQNKPTLVGIDQAHGLAAAKQKLTLLGGPNIDGLAGHYGATLFGGGR